MTSINELDTLRRFAKHLTRKLDIPRHYALDIIAKQYGHEHWAALMKAWDKGWCPAPHELIDINEIPEPIESETRALKNVKTIHGKIRGMPYRVQIGFDYVLIGGETRGIYFDHAPSRPPLIEKYKPYVAIDDRAFLEAMLRLGTIAADEVRAAIALDWPRQSTEPDADGSAKHPLFGGISTEWHCMHCETCSTGAEMAANLWHCPRCSATPLDMHPEAWWKQPARSA